MATAALAKGIGYWIQGSAVNNNGGAVNGDWSWYIGCWSELYNDRSFGAGCVAFALPLMADCLCGRTVSFACEFRQNTNEGTAQACISTTAPSGTEWRHGPTSGIVSNVITFSHSAKELSFRLNDGADLSGKTLYLYLYQENTDPYKLNSLVTISFGGGEFTYSAPYTLTVDAGTGSTVRVERLE